MPVPEGGAGHRFVMLDDGRFLLIKGMDSLSISISAGDDDGFLDHRYPTWSPDGAQVVLRPAPGKQHARVYDYVDIHVDTLVKAARARQRVYQGLPGVTQGKCQQRDRRQCQYNVRHQHLAGIGPGRRRQSLLAMIREEWGASTSSFRAFSRPFIS